MTLACSHISGQGEPVVLLHSSMSSKRQWKELAEMLSAHYQVFALDLTGYGAADFPDNPSQYSLKDECDHVDRLLKETGLSSDTELHLIGHSFGGATALYWAYRHQERMKSLQVFEPVAFHLLNKDGPAFDEINQVVTCLNDLLAKDDVRGACAHFINYWSGAGAFESFPQNVQDAMVAQVPKVVLDFQALIGAELGLDDYANMDFDMTLIKGTKSPLSSQTIALSLKDRLKDVRFFEVACGHMGPITHSAEINRIFYDSLQADR